MKIFILNLAIFSIFNSQAVIHFWNSVINFTKITVVAIFYMVSALTVWSSIEQINFFKKVKQRYLTLVEPELLEIEVIIGKIPKNKPHFGVWKINTFFFLYFLYIKYPLIKKQTEFSEPKREISEYAGDQSSCSRGQPGKFIC